TRLSRRNAQLSTVPRQVNLAGQLPQQMGWVNAINVWRIVMASPRFAFSDAHLRNLRSTSDLPLAQESDPGQWLLNDKGPSYEPSASAPAREITTPLSSDVNADLRFGKEICTLADFGGIV